MVTIIVVAALCVTVYSSLPYLLAILLAVGGLKTLWRALKYEHDKKKEES